MMELPCSYSAWEAEPELLTRCFDSINFTFIEIPFHFFQREEYHEGQAEVKRGRQERGKLKNEGRKGTEIQTKNWTLVALRLLVCSSKGWKLKNNIEKIGE